MEKKNLAARVILIVVLTAGGLTPPAQAGIPTLDSANFIQNILNTIESVARTLKQIEQYRTQLQQYENQLQNTTKPSTYIWDRAQETINGLLNATNTLRYYKNQLGSIDAYLKKFQDVDYYRNSPCFNGTGCSEAELTAMEENRRFASESQKKANDALFRGMDQQQVNLEHDAATLQRLQSSAQGADGQMQALGYANQLAANQSSQLLQIRGLLIAQQNAAAVRMAADADHEAQQQAAHEASTEWHGPEKNLPANPERW